MVNALETATKNEELGCILILPISARSAKMRIRPSFSPGGVGGRAGMNPGSPWGGDQSILNMNPIRLTWPHEARLARSARKKG
jgi:hypothetical protein